MQVNHYHSPCGKIHLYNSHYKMLEQMGIIWGYSITDPPYGLNAPNMPMGHSPNRKEKGQYPGESTATKLKGRLNTGSGKLKNRKLNQSKIDWDNETPPPEYFEMLRKFSKDQIIWGGNYFDLPKTRCWFIWDKLQPWENFSQFEMAWTSFDKPAAMFKLSNTGGGNKVRKIHPTEKPVRLYAELIRRFIPPGSTIVDTHGGSMTIARAVHDANLYDNMGLELHCFEISENYFKEAVVEFQKHIETGSLFPSVEPTQQQLFNI